MGSHPLNLAFRFILELCALVGLGFWGWKLGSGMIQYLFALGFPLSAAVLWGVFAVPEDPSRSGKAPIPVPGIMRLLLEFLILFAGVFGFWTAGYAILAFVLSFGILFHYMISFDRIKWLLKR